MVKPRQREYPTLKSSLNIVRETALIAISCVFWIYCFSCSTRLYWYYIWNSWRKYQYNTCCFKHWKYWNFRYIWNYGHFRDYHFVFLQLAYWFKMAERKRIVKYRKLIILVLSILIILPVSTLDGHHIANADDDPPKNWNIKKIVHWH